MFVYVLETCPVNKSVGLTNSLEFVANGEITKIFSTKSNNTVNDCLLCFNCVVSDILFYLVFKFCVSVDLLCC